MPKKPVKWGIKLAFTVYPGAETGVDTVTHVLGYSVVMKLMQNYLNEDRRQLFHAGVTWPC